MAAEAVVLEARLRRELDLLKRLSREMLNSLKLKQPPASTLRLRAIASILHDFYTGAEKIFVSVAKEIDGDVPQAGGWHRQLLEQMALELPNLRPPLLEDRLMRRLGDYLAFRHRFRNLYGFELNWDRMKGLAEEMPATVIELDYAVEIFLTQLRIFSSE